MTQESSTNAIETYRTVPEACRVLGIKKHALRRAINRGDIPSYQPFGNRRLVLVSEIKAAIQASQLGGTNEL